ncbi:hypothetical protein D9M69_491070 [compost metagenome]
MARGGVEAHQGYQGDGAGGDQPEGFRRAPERGLGGGRIRAEQQPADGQGQQQPGFHHQAGQGLHWCLLADQPVEAEGQRQGQGHPGQRPHLPDLLRHADGRQQHRDPLQAPQALTEDQHPQQHVDQRVDVVAQARLQHAAVVHRPDVDQPVAGDQHAAGGEHAEALGVVAQFAQPAGVFPDQQQERAEEGGPEGAMDDDLQRRNALDGLEVERKESPDDVGGEPQDVPAARVGGGHGMSLLRQLTSSATF